MWNSYETINKTFCRANVRVDKKDFVNAMSDYDQCIEMMSTDGEDSSSGRAQYGEYPDTFVGKTN